MRIVHRVLAFLKAFSVSKAFLAAENLALRHQAVDGRPSPGAGSGDLEGAGPLGQVGKEPQEGFPSSADPP